MPAPAFPEETLLRTAEGDELVVHLREVASPRAVVLLLHGAGEHAGRYARFAEELAYADIATVAPDQLGHGQTGRRGAGLATLGQGGNGRARRALGAVADEAARRHPGVPLILFGHSWGALLGQQLLAERPRRFAGAILSGATLALPGFLNPGRLNAGFEPDPTGLLWLTRDEAARRAFDEDPDCFDIDEHPVWSPLQSLALLSAPRLALCGGSGDVPVLIVGGTDDPLGYGRRGPTALARAFRRLGGLSDVTLRLYEGARHEALNETNRDEVVRDVVGWIAARFPRRAA